MTKPENCCCCYRKRINQKGTKTERAKQLGLLLAKKLPKLNIVKLVLIVAPINIMAVRVH
jgi:ribosomal protein L18